MGSALKHYGSGSGSSFQGASRGKGYKGKGAGLSGNRNRGGGGRGGGGGKVSVKGCEKQLKAAAQRSDVGECIALHERLAHDSNGSHPSGSALQVWRRRTLYCSTKPSL